MKKNCERAVECTLFSPHSGFGGSQPDCHSMSEDQKPQVKNDDGGNADHINLKVKGQVLVALIYDILKLLQRSFLVATRSLQPPVQVH